MHHISYIAYRVSPIAYRVSRITYHVYHIMYIISYYKGIKNWCLIEGKFFIWNNSYKLNDFHIYSNNVHSLFFMNIWQTYWAIKYGILHNIFILYETLNILGLFHLTSDVRWWKRWFLHSTCIEVVLGTFVETFLSKCVETFYHQIYRIYCTKDHNLS